MLLSEIARISGGRIITRDGISYSEYSRQKKTLEDEMKDLLAQGESSSSTPYQNCKKELEQIEKDYKTEDCKGTKDASRDKEDYAEKLFNKLWVELTNKEREEVQQHLEYDLNAKASKDCKDTKDGESVSYKGYDIQEESRGFVVYKGSLTKVITNSLQKAKEYIDHWEEE
jgi:hypothetical protein